jgi:Tn3 transposase DDE domain
MPTFDGGHYFLTVLVPVKTDPIPAGSPFTSPVHALRKKLAMLPPAQQTPACCDGQSPFARNTRNDFARFVVIDDVAYNGRVTQNSLGLALQNALSKVKINLVVAQPQDHLSCPFLLFSADFDAECGADSKRDSYLATLWNTMEAELREIFTHCEGFDGVNDEVSFAKYIARCQIETTMPFNDYYVDLDATVKSLPVWPVDKNLIPAGAGAVVIVLGLIIFCFMSGMSGLIVMLLGARRACRGEMVSNRREDHEISMLALHLLQNCMVYINTLMLQQVLARVSPREPSQPMY